MLRAELRGRRPEDEQPSEKNEIRRESRMSNDLQDPAKKISTGYQVNRRRRWWRKRSDRSSRRVRSTKRKQRLRQKLL